jgi:hypothetical protein
MSGDHPLVGGWRLRRWVALDEDGTETLPMGADANGLLTYTGDGTMIVVIGRADRPPFGSDDVMGGSEAERAGAFASFLAYGGRYEVVGGSVIHHVEASLFPNWVGTAQRRTWQFEAGDRRLTLVSPPLAVGVTRRTQRLTWERIGDQAPLS